MHILKLLNWQKHLLLLAIAVLATCVSPSAFAQSSTVDSAAPVEQKSLTPQDYRPKLLSLPVSYLRLRVELLRLVLSAWFYWVGQVVVAKTNWLMLIGLVGQRLRRREKS